MIVRDYPLFGGLNSYTPIPFSIRAEPGATRGGALLRLRLIEMGAAAVHAACEMSQMATTLVGMLSLAFLCRADVDDRARLQWAGLRLRLTLVDARVLLGELREEQAATGDLKRGGCFAIIL